MPHTSFAVLAFETSRLAVAPWRAMLTDTSARAELDHALVKILQPDVLRELPPTLALSDTPTAIDDWIAARDAECEMFTLRERAIGEVVGLLILARGPEPSDPVALHLGYLFAQSAWGKGLATELLHGLVEATADGTCLIGGVAKSNPASARVLEKIGFMRDPTQSDAETDIFTLTVNRR